ncbi:hypothetical protein Tco_1229807 [Tanacetum coccineum]
MPSITAQQAKLDLELVPKEKRLEIRKCNGRLNPGKIQREPTFQVVLDALALSPCYLAFLITTMFPKFTCINYEIQFTSMTLYTDSKWTKGRDSNSIWKSLEISLRSTLEYRVKTLIRFLLMKKLCLSKRTLWSHGEDQFTNDVLLIKAVNLG